MLRSIVLFSLLLVSANAPAEEPAREPMVANGAAAATPLTAAENLARIQQSMASKRAVMADLRKQLKELDDPVEKQEIEQRITRLASEIGNLQQSFNQIALNGISLGVLEEQPEVKINWKDELEQISRPLLSSLKELTEKPRQMDSLRRDIERKEAQLKIINRALDSLRNLKDQQVPAEVVQPLEQMFADWELRRIETRRALEISQYKLTNLETDTTTWYNAAGDSIAEFLKGRGLTLLLAVVIAVAIWLLSKAMLTLYLRWLYRTRADKAGMRAPLVLYSYRLATVVVIVLAVMMVFYGRGDILMLTLSVIALIGVALSLRQTLPRYTAELRLLLGVGPVREEERLVLDGVPLRVESLSIYTVLRNPELEGFLRVPLHDMNEHTSRPVDDEPWFPCRRDDYVVLENGSYGRVLRQTVELVELMILDSRVQMSTQKFLSLVVRNLNREGFGVAAKFGIDYQHQAICLDTVPARFRKGILARFEDAGMENDVRDLLVEFTEAGSSSLDYRIYVIMNPSAANALYRVQRMLQQACVQVCNEEGWVIPFTQVTLHTADDTDGKSLVGPAAGDSGDVSRPATEART